MYSDDQVTIDLGGSNLKKRGLNLRKANEENESIPSSTIIRRTIDIDYEAIKIAIRQRVIRKQQKALANNYSMYSMTNHDKIPDWIRQDTILGISASFIWVGLVIFFYRWLCYVTTVEDRTWPFIIAIGFALYGFIPGHWFALRNRRLLCRSFKQQQLDIHNKEIDDIFEQVLSTAQCECIVQIAQRITLESRIRSVCTVSPLRVLLAKPVSECILTIEPYCDYE